MGHCHRSGYSPICPVQSGLFTHCDRALLALYENFMVPLGTCVQAPESESMTEACNLLNLGGLVRYVHGMHAFFLCMSLCHALPPVLSTHIHSMFQP